MHGMSLQVIIAGAVSMAAVLTWLAWKPLRVRRRAAEVKLACQLFRLQREQLEAKFFDLAAGLGKPRGVRWRDCDWQNAVTFARDINTGMLTAFVAVNIHFEPVEGGDMEDVEAVGVVRDAAAVFHYSKKRWGTGGRALFNMNPEDALIRLQEQFEPVSIEASTSM